MTFERIPRVVHAERLSDPWSWTTEHGDLLSAAPGDYRITDPATREQWAVEPVAFSASYRHVGGESYESFGRVEARQVSPAGAAETVLSCEGAELAMPGDWVVVDERGLRWAVADAWFRSRYREVP
jgi:hypothetical protein